jgi:hypothetical protein
LIADPRYWAFISYSHRDSTAAERLHRFLETYVVPARLVGSKGSHGVIPKRLYPVFRDRDELPGAADLGARLRESLEASRSLVVVCSPASAASKWVDAEVRTFKAMGRADRVLCLVVDGEPNDSFCPALRVAVDSEGKLTDTVAEPIAGDAREGKDGEERARIKIVAGILGVGFDELYAREIRRRRATRIRRAVSVAALGVVAAGGYVGLADSGAQVPAGAGLREWLDRHGRSVLRPVHDAATVARTAADLRRAWSVRLDSDRAKQTWHEAAPGRAIPGVANAWIASQAAAAIMRAPEATLEQRRAALAELGPLFEPRAVVEAREERYGWRDSYSSFTHAEPVFWMVIALARALAVAGVVDAGDRTVWEERLAYAQSAAKPYRMKEGAWSLYPDQIAPAGHAYTSALALLALLETRASNLPWDRSVAARDALLASSAAWLESQFYRDGVPMPGWRVDSDDATNPVMEGLTLQIDSELLRAEREAGVALSSDILAALPNQLSLLQDRPLSFPDSSDSAVGTYVDDHGTRSSEQLPLTFFWYPWAVESCVQWLDRASRQGAPVEQVVRVRRALGHLVVDLAADVRSRAAQTFVVAEDLFGMTAVAP